MRVNEDQVTFSILKAERFTHVPLYWRPATDVKALHKFPRCLRYLRTELKTLHSDSWAKLESHRRHLLATISLSRTHSATPVVNTIWDSSDKDDTASSAPAPVVPPAS